MTPTVNGILSINKPRGMTSREAVDLVSRSIHPSGLRRRERVKVGHTGTLDPLATGVLIVCIGPATRLVALLQEYSKLYRAEFRLGETSDTDDCEGTVTRHDVRIPPTGDEIAAVLPEFIGRILQRPPAFSAIHVDGKRAYDFAREQQAVELASRPVDVYRFDIIKYDPPCLTAEVECGSGTYIRSLARDLGERIGTGALMSELTRIAIGPFRIEDAVSIAPGQVIADDELISRLHPLTSAVAHLPSLIVGASEAELVRHGGRLAWNAERQYSIKPPLMQIPRTTTTSPRPPSAIPDGGKLQSGRIAIIEEQADLVAVAEVHPNSVQPRIVLSR